MKLLELNLRPSDICTREAFEKAARVVAATGGSTNGGLHLPAMASEAGIEFDLFDVAEIFKLTPYIADLKPGGNYVAKDMYKAGGVYMVMKALLAGGFLHGNCMTVTGKTLGENIEEITWKPEFIIVLCKIAWAEYSGERPFVSTAMIFKPVGDCCGCH